jgi:hypothetical protein
MFWRNQSAARLSYGYFLPQGSSLPSVRVGRRSILISDLFTRSFHIRPVGMKAAVLMPVRVRFPEERFTRASEKGPSRDVATKAGRIAGSAGANSSGSASSSATSGATKSSVNGQGGLNTDQTPDLSASGLSGIPKNPGPNGRSERAGRHFRRALASLS